MPASSAPQGPADIVVKAIDGPVWVTWREGTLTRAKELEALTLWVRQTDRHQNDEVLAQAIDRHLHAARQAAKVVPLNPKKHLRIFRNGPLMERARSNLDAAEAHLLTLAGDDYILGQMPACSTTCNVISRRLTRVDRSLNESPGRLVSRIRTIHCPRMTGTQALPPLSTGSAARS